MVHMVMLLMAFAVVSRHSRGHVPATFVPSLTLQEIDVLRVHDLM